MYTFIWSDIVPLIGKLLLPSQPATMSGAVLILVLTPTYLQVVTAQVILLERKDESV